MSARSLTVLFIALFMFDSISWAFAQAQEIREADSLYMQQPVIASVQRAVEILSPVEEYAENYEVFWRLAQYYHSLGYHFTDKKEKKSAFQKGIKAAEHAVSLQPERVEGYFWLASNRGSSVLLASIFKKLTKFKSVRRSLEKVVEIDTTYWGAGGYTALGKMDCQLPGILGGNRKRGIDYLQRALALEPNNSLARIYLAEGYISERRMPEARKQLEILLDQKVWTNYELALTNSKKEAERLLREKFDVQQ